MTLVHLKGKTLADENIYTKLVDIVAKNADVDVQESVDDRLMTYDSKQLGNSLSQLVGYCLPMNA